MRAILDTSVLIADDAPTGFDLAISAVSLGELHFGLMLAMDDQERARRATRLAAVESTFTPLPVDGPVAREWGQMAALASGRGVKPRARSLDLLIAATACVHDAVLITHNVKDFRVIADRVDVRRP